MYPGFLHHWRRAHACADRHAHVHHHGHAGDHGHDPMHHAVPPRGRGGHGPHGHGPGFGVRRPLRVMAHELELSEEQTATLAQIIDELRTERAQGAVHEQRSLGKIAEALQAEELDSTALDAALGLRVQAAQELREATLSALQRTHAMLEPEQRKRLAYLLRSGVITI